MSCWSWLTGPVPLPGTLKKWEVLAGKDPAVVVLGWPADNPYLLDFFWILQQPWCITVLTDLIMVTTVYFSSECNPEESGQKDR